LHGSAGVRGALIQFTNFVRNLASYRDIGPLTEHIRLEIKMAKRELIEPQGEGDKGD
jgi:hypothetical protein